MFRTVSLSIIRSLVLYTQQWYMSYRFAVSLRAGSGWNWIHPDPASSSEQNLYDIYHCCVYSAGLLSSILIPLASIQYNLYDLYLLLCVQC